MKLQLLDRLLLGEVFRFFIFGLALFTTILVAMEELQPLTSMVVEHGVPLSTALRIFLLSLPYFMALAFPMAMLLATLMAFGSLSQDSETTALVAAGVSYYRMAVPISVVGVVVSLLAIGFNEFVAPVATREKNRLYTAAIASGVPSNQPFYYHQMSAGRSLFTLLADNYDGETQKMVRPTIVYFGPDGKPNAVEWGRLGTWSGGTDWAIHDGFVQGISSDPTTPVRLIQFQEQRVSLGISIEQLLAASEDPNALSYRQLEARIAEKRKEGRSAGDIDPDVVTLYSKISIPFASLVFALIGFPLGIRRQRSANALGFALSIAIIFIYYLIYQYATILGNNAALTPLVSAWLPDLLGLVVGLYLIWRVSSA